MSRQARVSVTIAPDSQPEGASPLNGDARRNYFGPSATVRWIAISIFALSGVLNYLDRQILATMVDIWRTQHEFPFTYDDYGILLSVFSLAYALSALFVGWFYGIPLHAGALAPIAFAAVHPLNPSAVRFRVRIRPRGSATTIASATEASVGAVLRAAWG